MARIGSYPIDAVIQDKDAWIGTENTNRVTRQFTAKGIAEYIDTKNVGLVFVGATNLLPGKKGLVPAPLAGQEGMYLKGDLGGGWTTIPVYTLDVPTGTTNVNLINTDGAGAIINSFITLTGGTYLTSVHTSGSQITFNHDNTTRSDTTSTASPAAGASVPLVASVTSNATGHITAIDVKTVTWPADSDTTYTIDVPNATTSINLAGSDGTNDPIAFTTVAGNNGMTISRTDANTLNFNSKWQINNVNQDGYVPKGTANANKFWATDANGNPGWTFQPSQDQTLTSTGTTNASTGIVLSQNGGTVIVKGDGSTISASSNNTTNVITLEAINRVNTTYTLPVAAGAANTAVINLTDNSAVVSSVTFNGTANKIAISETVGNNGDITIGMPDNVTVTGELTVSGNGQSSFGGQVTIPQTPTADTDAASKKYVDDLVSGGLTFRGTFNAATGAILSGVSSGSQLYNCPGGAGTRIAVAVGDYYIVATAGGSFYCSGATLDIGDSIIATAAASADASVVTGWSVVQSDEGVASFTNANGTFVSAGTVNSNATGAVTMGTIDLSATGTKDGTTFLRGDNTWAVPAYVSYSAMTTSTLGLGKIKYDFGSTPAAESQSTTTARTYGVTKNASDQLVVNVPWVNSSDVNSVTASGAATALSGLSSTPNTGSVVIGLDINGRASLGSPAGDDELMIYDTSTAKNVKVLVSDLASYAGSAATNQVTYWTSANEIGGATGFTFAGGANGAVTMGGTLTVASTASIGSHLTINGVSAGTSTYQQWKNDGTLFAYNGSAAAIISGGSATDYVAGNTTGSTSVILATNNSARLTINSSGNATFAGDVQAPGIYVGATNTSFDFYNQGTSYFNGTVTVDAAFTQSGGDASTFSGNVGIGITPSAKLDVTTATAGWASIIQNTNGASDANGLLIKAGTGATEYSLKVSNSDDSTNFMVVKGNGNVGIGTNSPGNVLDVAGDTDISGQLFVQHSGSYTAKLKQLATSMSNATYTFEIDSTAHTSNLSTAGAMSVDVDSGRAFTINGLGNVGIGTNSPANVLHLKSNDPKLILEDGNAGTDEKVYAIYPAGSQYVLQTQTDAFGAGQQVYVVDRTGTTVDGQKWYINNTQVLTIDNAGNIGMGIDVPTEKLDIVKASGNTNIRVYDSSANSEVGLKLQSDAKTWTLQNWGSGGDKLRVLNNAGTSMQVWEDDGSVIFGGTDINGSFGASNTVLAVQGSTSGGEGILQITGKGNNATDNVGKIDFHSYSEADPMCSIRSIRGGADDIGSLQFLTNSGGGASSIRMTISSSGDVESPTTLGFKLNAPASNFTYPSYGFVGHTGRGMTMANSNELDIVMGGGARHKMMSGTNTAYVADGLFGTNATPDVVSSASGGGIYLGYQDNGSGLYAQAYGFLTKSTDGLGNTSSRDCIQIKDVNTGTINFSITNLGAVTARGTITASGNPSDIRLKENIKPIDNALSKIKKIQGVSFDWKPSDSIVDIKEDYGFIAQEVQKSLPEIIKEDQVGMLSMRYNSVIPILVESVKELEKVVKDLKKEIIELKK